MRYSSVLLLLSIFYFGCSKSAQKAEFYQIENNAADQALEAAVYLDSATLHSYLSPVFDSIVLSIQFDENVEPKQNNFNEGDCEVKVYKKKNDAWSVVESQTDCGSNSNQVMRWIYKNNRLVFYQDISSVNLTNEPADFYIYDELLIQREGELHSMEREITVEEFHSGLISKSYYHNNRTVTQIESASKWLIRELFAENGL
ncbi:hypothetical protein MY04_0863 [Flammeovirga sp. MY04]|uniref:hypothetical protein n=1 Tax=Flammeovirga sp. MY04 TaxID=1191459 RepID=UPI0008063033|nr:hypothetical protein [Flammeovirga sp. MY04]ANQ48245.1 hypothetical protein MY04_0863 [Flammeovirga sp. MY04]